MAMQTVKVTINGTDYTLTYNATSGKYEATITAPTGTSWGLTDHVYPCVVTATDTAGNSATADRTKFPALGLRVKETTKPVIATVSPSASAFVTNAKPPITWQVTDANSGIDPSTISLKIDSGAVITSGITTEAITNGYQCTYTPDTALADGQHTISFNVGDNDGNAAVQVSVAFTVDTIAPTLNVTAPGNGLVTNQAVCTVSGTVTDVTSGLASLKVNGTEVPVSSGAFTTTITLAEGSNTVTVVATDNAGKSTTVTRTVTLDTVAPVISAVTLMPSPAVTGETLTITVAVSDP